MKLLIVDDEMLTRKGIISSIDWAALNIDEVLQADDGMNALTIAKKEQPDIILCDIRMPRMTGIELAEKVEELLPNTSIIFMSGYSDKEYLKAAIKLKAINYIEKPLNPNEIREAILEAKERVSAKALAAETATRYSSEVSTKLALLFTKPHSGEEEAIQELISRLNFPIQATASFTTYLLRIDGDDILPHQLDHVRVNFETLLTHYNLKYLYTSLHSYHHVFFVINQSPLGQTIQYELGRYLSKLFSAFCSFSISYSQSSKGLGSAYESYSNCVIMLQQGFFFPNNTLIHEDVIQSASDAQVKKSAFTISIADFTNNLTAQNLEGCHQFLEQIKSYYDCNTLVLKPQVKDLYYRLLTSLHDARTKQKLNESAPFALANHSIMEQLDSCFSFEKLHNLLLSETEEYFEALSNHTPEDATIFLIKNYIAQNYHNELLSIKEISEHANLSVSYMCTYFKSQTGQTLNQYLTEYRMERAKQLLEDVRIHISDISDQVGYSNGNYFGKTFKKYSGLSPSQYREKTERW